MPLAKSIVSASICDMIGSLILKSALILTHTLGYGEIAHPIVRVTPIGIFLKLGYPS
jgi:hypothetical protein